MKMTDRDRFNAFFLRLMINTESAFERDVLRMSKEYLWDTWKLAQQEVN